MMAFRIIRHPNIFSRYDGKKVPEEDEICSHANLASCLKSERWHHNFHDEYLYFNRNKHFNDNIFLGNIRYIFENSKNAVQKHCSSRNIFLKDLFITYWGLKSSRDFVSKWVLFIKVQRGPFSEKYSQEITSRHVCKHPQDRQCIWCFSTAEYFATGGNLVILIENRIIQLQFSICS